MEGIPDAAVTQRTEQTAALQAEVLAFYQTGKHDEAIDRFKRIYEDTLDLRDITEVVDDYYASPRAEWITKYQARFKK